jgi:hypothetical protein
MRVLVKGIAAAAVLTFAMPATAQQPQEAADNTQLIQALEQAYKPEPLTPEQQERLPAATRAAGRVMPNGFYARIMQSSMDRIMGPLLDQFTVPSVEDLAKDIGYQGSKKPQLDAATTKRLLLVIDPVADQRAKVATGLIMSKIVDMMSQFEGPIREGLAKSYAVRFTDQQLADINAFFATPTGEVYASQSMEAFTDPQTMSAMAQTMPLFVQQFQQQLPQIFGGLQEALSKMPSPRTFSDLSPPERQQLATAFGISVDQLRTSMARVARDRAAAVTVSKNN